MENSFCTQAIISIILVLVTCLFIGISYKDTLVIIILASLIVFLYQLLNLYNNRNNIKINKSQNILLDNLQNNIPKINNNNNDNNNVVINKLNNKNKNVDNIPYHLKNTSDNIIDAKMYNLEDCTTDKTCLQEPDENNLFTGFDNKKVYLAAKSSLPCLIKDKIKNNSKKVNNLVIEKFENSNSPEELLDIVAPFNDTIIKPFYNLSENLDDIRTNEQKKNEVYNIDDEICFNCKIGECKGGICKDINEIKTQKINDVVNEINKLSKENKNIKRYHPFSINFPTIRTTNNELID